MKSRNFLYSLISTQKAILERMSVNYLSPLTISEATDLLSKNSGSTKILSGGTDLLVSMRLSKQNPDTIEDIKNIAQTREIIVEDNLVSIGAAVPAIQITEHPQMNEMFPGLVEATELIGSSQIQSRASIGGNLCNASPAADTVPSLVANDAQCHIAGPRGERIVSVNRFCTGPGKNILEADEFLVKLVIPLPKDQTSDAYLRFTPRNEMDIAVVGAGVSVSLDKSGTCKSARVALGAVAPTVMLVAEAADVLIDSKLEDSDLNKLASLVSNASKPITDKRGTSEFRKHVVGVLAKRATLTAKNRIIAKSK